MEQNSKEEPQRQQTDRPAQEATEDSGSQSRQGASSWVQSLSIPPYLALGACVMAAFLVVPAYFGLISISKTRDLQRQVDELRANLEVARAQPVQRIEPRPLTTGARVGSRVLISPVLELGNSEPESQDLIQVEFAGGQPAILLFSLLQPLEFVAVKATIFRDRELVWTDTTAAPVHDPANPRLITFLLAPQDLVAGPYHLIVEGTRTTGNLPLGRFDLLIKE